MSRLFSLAATMATVLEFRNGELYAKDKYR
jgi:hypothetical protein